MLKRSAGAAMWAWLAAAPAVAAPATRGRNAWEGEVHLSGGPNAPPGREDERSGGAGARAFVTLGSAGVSARVEDWISLGLGVELLRAWGGSPYGACVERTPGPAGTSVCTRVDAPANGRTFLLVPVVAQWSFGVTPSLSLFFEPGLMLFFSGPDRGGSVSVSVGGRLRFVEPVAAVLRLGWPVSTLGVSF